MVQSGLKWAQKRTKVTKMGQNGLQKAQKGLFGSILAMSGASRILLSLLGGPHVPTIVKKKKWTKLNYLVTIADNYIHRSV